MLFGIMLLDEISFILNNKYLYIFLESSCVGFAAHGAQIPGRDEEAANNVPGKVRTPDGGEGLELLLSLLFICVLCRP